MRRGSKVEMNVPLYRDVNTTKQPLPLPSVPSALPAPLQKPYTIYMDSMAFGMGCCCLQVTIVPRALLISSLLSNVAILMTPEHFMTNWVF